MKQNSAGGVSFMVDPWMRLDRFLILGTAGGSYYASAQDMTIENSQAIIALIKEDGIRAVHRIVEVSDEGLAPKNDPAVFALALAATYGDAATKEVAYLAITKVCRIGTHLFQFCQAVQDLRGWSRGLRNGVGAFYKYRTPEEISFQMMKYRQRDGWTHRDVIRLSHPKFPEGAEGLAYKAIGKEPPKEALPRRKGSKRLKGAEYKVPEQYTAFEEVQAEFGGDLSYAEQKELVKRIEKFKLPWEALPTKALTYTPVWESLLPHMGMTALLRNLGRLTELGIISQNGMDDTTRGITSRFQDFEELKKGRLHPLTILNALMAYKSGTSKGGKTWDPSSKILNTLDEAFYLSFGTVESTGLRHFYALDISGSMTYDKIAGTSLTPREASAALALVGMNREKDYFVGGFHKELIPLDLNPKMRLDAVMTYIDGLDFGTTDCAAPAQYAQKHKMEIDCFQIYTDSETYQGNIHASQALEQYRQEHPNAKGKQVVVGMTATGFTIADPADPRQLDVVGFSLDTPAVISQFAQS